MCGSTEVKEPAWLFVERLHRRRKQLVDGRRGDQWRFSGAVIPSNMVTLASSFCGLYMRPLFASRRSGFGVALLWRE